MPMIQKPSAPQKGSSSAIFLDKTVLAAVASVAADDYFSDSSNWSEVLIDFKSSEGNQRKILKFDATETTPSAWISMSNKARDEFQVQKVVIKDFDNGIFTVDRSELVVADFDIDMSLLLFLRTSEDYGIQLHSQSFGTSYQNYLQDLRYSPTSVINEVVFHYTNTSEMTDNTQYKFRFYFSELTSSVGGDFIVAINSPVGEGDLQDYVTGTVALNSFNTDGYIELTTTGAQGNMAGGNWISLIIGSSTFVSISFTLTKIEIYPV